MSAARGNGQPSTDAPATATAGLREVLDHAVPFRDHLDITVVEAQVGRAVLVLPMAERLGTRRPEVMHGGALATLIDAAAAAAVLTTKTADDTDWAGMATTDLNVSYLAAATADVRAEATVLRATRRIAFTTVTVTSADGRGDAPVAVGRVTLAITRRTPRA